MIISDFITLDEEHDVEVPAKSLELALHKKAQWEAAELLSLYYEYEVRAVKETVSKGYNKLRGDILRETGTLPKTLSYGSKDGLSRLSESPKVKLSEARKLSNTLGFPIVPYSYMNANAPTWDERRAIEGFVEATLLAGMQPYVLCPMTAYQVTKHVAAEGIYADLPIYAPKDISQAFAAINMSIPMFRSLQKNVDHNGKRISKVEADIVSLSTKLDQLAAQVEQQQREAIEARVEQDTRSTAEGKRLIEASMLVRVYDPMLLAIPADKSIHDKTWAIVGPCWGADFPDIVLAAMSIEKIPGQRKRLANLAAKFSS
jgi:hypothetical protein